MDAYSNSENEQSNKKINYSITQHGYMPRYIKVKNARKLVYYSVYIKFKSIV